MKYPSLRYGNPAEFAYYVQGVPLDSVARRLRRSERSVKDWLAGNTRMPWWIPELLRLQGIERDLRFRQMNMISTRRKLGLVDAKVLDFPRTRQRPDAMNDAFFHGNPPPALAAA